MCVSTFIPLVDFKKMFLSFWNVFKKHLIFHRFWLALFPCNVNTKLRAVVCNNHSFVRQYLCFKCKLWCFAKIVFFCFGCIILYYSLGAETSGLGVVFFFAPNAHVHGPRVSWKNGRQIKVLNTRIIWTTVSILKKTEFDFKSCNNFYSPTNIAYFSQKSYFFAKSRERACFVQGHITLCVCKHIWRSIPFLNRPGDLLLI